MEQHEFEKEARKFVNDSFYWSGPERIRKLENLLRIFYGRGVIHGEEIQKRKSERQETQSSNSPQPNGVPKTIQDLTSGDVMKRVLDLSCPIEEIAETLSNHWSYDLFKRRPGPALLKDGVLHPTDLDLACFLSALVDRSAVINLPHYESRRAAQKNPDEVVWSKANRHGKIVGLTSNKDVFSFSVRIIDLNVMKTGEGKNESGAFRNFMLVDLDGKWWDGWRSIEFVPDAKENDFISGTGIGHNNTILFKNFVHPNRWTSFYGQYYLLTKVVIERLENELKFFKKTLKDPTEKPNVSQRKASGPSKSIKVKTLQVEVDHPPFSGEVALGSNEWPSKIRGILSKLRFASRVTEFSFFDRMVKNQSNHIPLAAWVKRGSTLPWNTQFKKKGGRTIWNQLDMGNCFALRFRLLEKSERVRAD